MLTTINARRQSLRVLSLGLVGNTHTQEGVVIYSEYCSGNLTSRVYRGGGFTKDVLYLKGFRDIVNLSKTMPLDNLREGKAGLLDLPIISEMVERNMLENPVALFGLQHTATPDTAVLDYLLIPLEYISDS
ncbi:DUF1704 domain-containing protein [Shewanella abyssi]|uniref:tyrosine/phenylalanine carboxypeptidase domain-containing protein n=1 Tax=Shewanella abyssi TaxID=311789 RepID=UPI00200DA033|nr:tyrosine/phenylalanine carboxypeptidase domain-containing protein [Shewanella abyssi]MCL1051466.1 DUF1704 domain-containing protein [Shewanella abyssi]